MTILDLFRASAPMAERIAPTIGNAIVQGETVQSSDRIKMGEMFAWPGTPSGAAVTTESAMRVSVVYACVSRIAGAIACMPLPIFERTSDFDRKPVHHDYWWLLNEQPTATFAAASFWEFIVGQVLLRGDGISYLVRNRAGVVTSVIPWPRSRVTIELMVPDDPRQPQRLQYFFQGIEGYFGADQDDVLHFPGFGFDGIRSMSVIQWGARNGIGIAIRGDEFAGKFFAQGAQPQFAIKAPGTMTLKQQEEFREAWVSKYTGMGGGPNGIPLMLTEGLDVKELTMSAVDAQLLESRRWQVVDICRAFGVPPFMVGEMDKTSSWGSGVEQMSIGFVQYTLSPHLKRFEQELNRKLFRTPTYFTEFNSKGLLRGDVAAQTNYYKASVGGTQNAGWMTVNEIRRDQNLPPVKDGDEIIRPTRSEPDNAPPPENPPADDPNTN